MRWADTQLGGTGMLMVDEQLSSRVPMLYICIGLIAATVELLAVLYVRKRDPSGSVQAHGDGRADVMSCYVMLWRRSIRCVHTRAAYRYAQITRI